ncbi:hypothetical protein GW17_00043628 [Ensete ventricosum]|nr:hypothetical protein GW17_00043628 [Ensete ventricosum]
MYDQGLTYRSIPVYHDYLGIGMVLVLGGTQSKSTANDRFLAVPPGNGNGLPVDGMAMPHMHQFDHMLWAMLGLDDDAKVLSGADYNTPVINQLICKFGTSIEAILVEIFPAIASRLIVVLPKDAFPSGPGCNTEV